MKQSFIHQSSNWMLAVYAIAFTSLHVAANLYGWYEAYWWIDAVAHVGGGIWVAWAAYAYRHLVHGYEAMPPWVQAAGILAFVALVGVFWELYEAVADAWKIHAAGVSWSGIGEAFGLPPYDHRWDTLWDLFNDLLGGAIVAVVALVRLPRLGGLR